MRRAIIVSAPFKRKGEYSDLLAQQDQMGPQKDYDWTADVKNIRTPLLLICGDADLYPPSHAAEFFGLLGGEEKDAGWDGKARPQSQLAILPNTTHYNICMNPALATTAANFLDSK